MIFFGAQDVIRASIHITDNVCDKHLELHIYGSRCIHLVKLKLGRSRILICEFKGL